MRSTPRRILLFMLPEDRPLYDETPCVLCQVGNRPQIGNRFAGTRNVYATINGVELARQRTVPALTTPGPLHWLRNDNADDIPDDTLEVITRRLIQDLA